MPTREWKARLKGRLPTRGLPKVMQRMSAWLHCSAAHAAPAANHTATAEIYKNCMQTAPTSELYSVCQVLNKLLLLMLLKWLSLICMQACMLAAQADPALASAQDKAAPKQLRARTNCSQGAPEGVASADDTRRNPAPRQLQQLSCQIAVRPMRLAHAHKLLQEACRQVKTLFL